MEMKKITQQAKQHPLMLLAVCVFIIIVVLVMISRIHAYYSLRDRTNKQAVPIVAVIRAKRGPVMEDIVLPGNIQAWHEATIYARTNGYIKKWLVDIGDHVKKGDLLAVIEAPEVDAQLRQAEADLKTAVANNNLAQITAKRWLWLLKSDSVSKQEADEKVGSAQALYATLVATKANRDRLRELVGYERVTAPFDGVISARYTDIGALINAGSNTAAPLFHLVQADPLRVYVRIPQIYATRIKPDMTVSLQFPQQPGKTYSAKLFQTAKAIDATTRTLLAEFYVNNKDYTLLAGGFTEVHFKMPTPTQSVRLPVNALVFRAQGLQIAAIDNDSTVTLKNINISRDFGQVVEISSGIKPGEVIILNPSDSIFNGQKVRIAKPEARS